MTSDATQSSDPRPTHQAPGGAVYESGTDPQPESPGITGASPTSLGSAALDDLDALADADPAAAPEIADRIAAVLAERLEASRPDRGTED